MGLYKTTSSKQNLRSELAIGKLNCSSNPYDPSSDLPGALGEGQSVASGLGNFFKFWAYTSTVIGAIVAGKSSMALAEVVSINNDQTSIWANSRPFSLPVSSTLSAF